MVEIKDSSNLHIETDKRYAPYLLAASYRGILTFKFHYFQHGVLHWVFYPKNRAIKLIEMFQTLTDPQMPAQDLFTAIDVFWSTISKYKINLSLKGQTPTGVQATLNNSDKD